jgi:Leucine-rich repeat (LRR) protein
MPLRCLYLSKNLISKIQGLESLSSLVTLDLSNNRLTNIGGLEGCTSLKTINLQRNALTSVEGLEGLVACPSLDNIDITNNRIEGDVTSLMARLPSLHALSVNGNPCTQTQGFRKRTIAAIPTLTYLDRPIDEIEKVGAHAFVTEGPEKEQEVRLAFIAKQKQDRSDELNQFKTWQREQLAIRKEKIASGNTEGMSLITEFTPEEQAQRQAEAQKAAGDSCSL